MKKYLHLFFLSLFFISASKGNCQFILKGIVKDSKREKGISGVSVFETGTSNGTTTDNNGKYSLELENDSALISFSATNYLTVQILVLKNDPIIELETILQEANADFDSLLASHTRYPRATIGFKGGLKYTPFGLTFLNYKPNYLYLPVYINELSYETNLKNNNNFYAALGRSISIKKEFNLNLQANYKSININSNKKDLHNKAYSFLVGTQLFKYYFIRVGPAYRNLIVDEKEYKQFGGRVIVNKYIYPLGVYVSTEMAVYPKYNHFSFSVNKNIFSYIYLGSTYEKLSDYQEVKINLTYTIF